MNKPLSVFLSSTIQCSHLVSVSSPCRFLQVHPACVEDEQLLVGIVAFLNAYFRQMHTESAPASEDKDLRWILELLLNQVQIFDTFWKSGKVEQ